MSDGYIRLVEKLKNDCSDNELRLLEMAYKVSKSAHDGQQRVSGDPFIIHPVEVANILADLEMDITSIVAALLHDTIEDTTCTYEEIKKQFGAEVADLVDGVTKIGKIQFTSKEEEQAENFRKMFLAMAKDIRVILIKLADRLHNMRTLKYKPSEKRIATSRETLEIYAPLAHRLGIFKIKWELEDICMRYLKPEIYYDLVEKISKKRKERETFLSDIVNTLKNKLTELGLKMTIEGRPKHFYSIYTKMYRQNKTLEQIYDIFAVRIIVDSVKDCYTALGAVHELYKPIPGRFKDYIAMPKPNMYQSLHTTLIGKEGIPFEVQIRTWEMHRVAEYGIAAHWKYKEGRSKDSKLDVKLAWLRQLLDWQNDMRDADEFMKTLRIDLFTDEVFVFTPKGDVKSLPSGSTPIDFAYAIHSGVGNSMMGAKINGKIVPLGYKLNNGDIVEILTSSNVVGPSRDWLKIARSSQARSKINQWFKKEKKDENIIRGKELVERDLKKHGLTHTQLFKPEWVDIVLKKYTFLTIDDLYAGIGYGGITANKVISRLKEEYRKTVKEEEPELLSSTLAKDEKKKKQNSEKGIIVKGIDNCLVRLAQCCNPVPGDEIVGFVTKGRGVSVHRTDCVNMANNMFDEDRIIEVMWDKVKDAAYKADVNLLAHDRSSLIVDITNTINENGVPLKGINARTTRDQIAIINITMEILNTQQLDKIIRKLKRISGVFQVTRMKH